MECNLVILSVVDTGEEMYLNRHLHETNNNSQTN